MFSQKFTIPLVLVLSIAPAAALTDKNKSD